VIERAQIIQQWGVARSYEVRDRLLVAVGPEVRGYDPLVKSELPIKLADLHLGKISPLAFTLRYGFLGYDSLVPIKKRLGGDPIEWIRAHALTVFVALELMGRMQAEDDPYPLMDFLKRIPKGRYGFLAEQKDLDFSRLPRSLDFAIRTHSRQKTRVPPVRLCEALAKRVVQDLVNPNIARIRRQLTMSSAGQIHSVFRFDAMVQCAYWQIANQLESGGGIRRCEYCGRFFVASHPNERFCPPSGSARRSKCGQNDRARRSRGAAKPVEGNRVLEYEQEGSRWS
jgi:hypothetical protein